jgi:hypothetical protein
MDWIKLLTDEQLSTLVKWAGVADNEYQMWEEESLYYALLDERDRRQS